MKTPVIAKRLPIRAVFLTVFVVTACASAKVGNIDLVSKADSANKYFYLKIFSGYFPIPLRYAVTVPKGNHHTPHEIELNHLMKSPANMSKEETMEMFTSGIGFIRVGAVSSGAEDYGSVPGVRLLKEERLYGLTVKTYAKKDSGSVNDLPVMLAYVSDGVNYLSMLEEDHSLLPELLMHYGEFNNIQR